MNNVQLAELIGGGVERVGIDGCSEFTGRAEIIWDVLRDTEYSGLVLGDQSVQS